MPYSESGMAVGREFYDAHLLHCFEEQIWQIRKRDRLQAIASS